MGVLTSVVASAAGRPRRACCYGASVVGGHRSYLSADLSKWAGGPKFAERISRRWRCRFVNTLSERGRLPVAISCRLEVPLVVAPMFSVSGVDLVATVCRSGAIGAFPTVNARSVEELDYWLSDIEEELAKLHRPAAPHCPNLIIGHPRMKDDLACLVRHKVEMVITSLGSPSEAIQPLHAIGCLVFAVVASLRHAEKAIKSGADGLVLLTAGAGGHTGWANPFAFARAIRGLFDGPVALAGGIVDGVSLAAARLLGCDLAYMGTRFIATRESLASTAYQQMLANSTIDDVVLTRAFTGLDVNMLRPSIVAVGLDPAKLDELVSATRATEMYGVSNCGKGPRRWLDIWSAGHSTSGVRTIVGAAELVRELTDEYKAALEVQIR